MEDRDDARLRKWKERGVSSERVRRSTYGFVFGVLRSVAKRLTSHTRFGSRRDRLALVSEPQSEPLTRLAAGRALPVAALAHMSH